MLQNRQSSAEPVVQAASVAWAASASAVAAGSNNQQAGTVAAVADSTVAGNTAVAAEEAEEQAVAFVVATAVLPSVQEQHVVHDLQAAADNCCTVPQGRYVVEFDVAACG